MLCIRSYTRRCIGPLSTGVAPPADGQTIIIKERRTYNDTGNVLSDSHWLRPSITNYSQQTFQKGPPQDGSPGIDLARTPGISVRAAGMNDWTGLAAGDCDAVGLLPVAPE